MRRLLVFLAAAPLVAGCSSTSSSPSESRSEAREVAPDSLQALASAPGPDTAVVPGASDFAPGEVRYTFLVIAPNGAPVERPRARVWLSRGLNRRPFETRVAVLEPVGVPGTSDEAEVTHLYVARLNVARPGKYWLLAAPIGGKPIQALGNLIVHGDSLSPAIGAKAYRSETPTLRSAHGDVSKLTTRVPPDSALLRYSVADSVAAHKPFVLVFATPKFCTSRTCGPVVDVVDAVRKKFLGGQIRFIHVEIYRDNDPTKGFNRWVREWHLPTEPWVFLVDRNATIKEKFEGSVSIRELTKAVRRTMS